MRPALWKLTWVAGALALMGLTSLAYLARLPAGYPPSITSALYVQTDKVGVSERSVGAYYWRHLEDGFAHGDRGEMKRCAGKYVLFQAEIHGGSHGIEVSARRADADDGARSKLMEDMRSAMKTRDWQRIGAVESAFTVHEHSLPRLSCVLRPSSVVTKALLDMRSLSSEIEVYGMLEKADVKTRRIWVDPIWFGGGMSL